MPKPIPHETFVSIVQASWLTGNSVLFMVNHLERQGYSVTNIQVQMAYKAFEFLNREMARPFTFTIHH